MKKISTLIMALALALGMSQCKKNVETVTPSPYGKAVYITVNVNGGKHQVVTGTGAVNYTDGDKIYVGNNGKYIGFVEYSNGVFGGTIYDPVETDYLHFYFVGGLETGDLNVGSTTSFTVNISDQRTNLPVLSYARSDVKYTDNNTVYSCELKNKCALVKFALTESTEEYVYVGGMKTSATISFANPNNAIVADNTTGNIRLYSVSGTEKWAILLPQAQVEDAPVDIDGDDFTVTVPAITINAYITSGIEIDNHYVWEYHGFKVGDNKYVDIAPGNLQYKDGSGFRFAPKEYEYYETFVNTDGWVSLFNWAGWTGNPAHDPLSTRNWDQQWAWDNTDFYGDPTGNDYTWRTLTRDEFEYMLYSTKSGGFTTITDGNKSYIGLVIRPHGLDKEVQESYTAAQWAVEQAEGSIFLPAAGLCHHGDGTQIPFNDFEGVGQDFYYWTSTADSDSSTGLSYCFYASTLGALDMASDSEAIRMSVRLVRDRQ